MKQVGLFIGGACNGNPGPGGWGAILRLGPHEKLLSGAASDTTLNRMDMTAAIHGLRALIEPCEVTVNTGCRIIVDGIARFAEGWTRSGWVDASHKPVRNADLWHDLIAAAQRHEMGWQWHADEVVQPEIARARSLAQAADRHLTRNRPTALALCCAAAYGPPLDIFRASSVLRAWRNW